MGSKPTPEVNRRAQRRYHASHRDAIRAKKRERYRRDRAAELQRFARRRATPRGKAGAKLRYAVWSGKLKKPDRCEGCQRKLPKRLIQGHHADYSKPLTVRW